MKLVRKGAANSERFPELTGLGQKAAELFPVKSVQRLFPTFEFFNQCTQLVRNCLAIVREDSSPHIFWAGRNSSGVTKTSP